MVAPKHPETAKRPRTGRRRGRTREGAPAKDHIAIVVQLAWRGASVNKSRSPSGDWGSLEVLVELEWLSKSVRPGSHSLPGGCRTRRRGVKWFAQDLAHRTATMRLRRDELRSRAGRNRRRSGHRHHQGVRRGGRGRRRRYHHPRRRDGAVPRPAQGDRRQHRLDRSVHQGRDRERADDGRRRDPDRLRRRSAGSHVRSSASDGVAAIAGGEVYAQPTSSGCSRAPAPSRSTPTARSFTSCHASTPSTPGRHPRSDWDGGVRLGVKVNLVTAATTCVQNVVRCAERCGLTVADVVLQPLASAEAVLSDDEKEIGVAVIDIGGGTTDFLLYVDGGIAHTSVIPVGGNNITGDIAAGFARRGRGRPAQAARRVARLGASLRTTKRSRSPALAATRHERRRAEYSRTSSNRGSRRFSSSCENASRTPECSNS